MSLANALEGGEALADLILAADRSVDERENLRLLLQAEERSHAEVASILGCKESTVSWRMHEVRKQLTELMEGDHV